MDKKLLAVMGGGLLIGGGVFGWYVLYGDRMVARDAAQKPIAQWEAAWHHTRTCLLGDHPTYDIGDELAVRAFRGELESCSLAGVGPPEMPGTGIDEIEDAWEQVRAAWHDLSIAQPDADREAGPVRALDAAEARLREGAGLDPLPPGPTRRLTDLVLAPGGAKVSIDRLVPRAHALAGGGNPGWVTARGAQDVTITPPTEADRGWPDPSWGAMLTMPDAPDTGGATDDGTRPPALPVTVTSGAIDTGGQLRDEVVVAKGQFLAVAAAVGGGADRTIVLRTGAAEVVGGLVAVHTTDGGAHWTKPEAIAGTWVDAPWRWPGDPPVWVDQSDDGPGGLLFLDEHGANVRVASPVALIDAHACTAGAAIWYVAPGGSLGRVGTGQPIDGPDGAEPIACTADAVALRTNEKIYRCTLAGCDHGLDVPGSSQGFADVFDGGGVVFAMQRDRLIGVWRNGVEPAFVRAPAGATLVGVAVWGKTPTFAFETEAGLRFAPMP